MSREKEQAISLRFCAAANKL